MGQARVRIGKSNERAHRNLLRIEPPPPANARDGFRQATRVSFGDHSAHANREVLARGNAKEKICEATPLKTLDLPHNVAEVVIHFAPDESGWTTGSLLAVDGGAML